MAINTYSQYITVAGTAVGLLTPLALPAICLGEKLIGVESTAGAAVPGIFFVVCCTGYS